ncbi:MAG: DUF308 domain-containing protein [Prevotellaceae bacterium]|jgi:uncharacterized membrane protein HdeD (DUF308 family)|nr:DUF308 domain-containing protein [Prevotellaceae bacterium]
MEERFLKSIKSAIKNWWVSLILGILYIVMAIWMFCDPIEGYTAIAIAFSIVLFASGIMEIYFAATNCKIIDGWGWYLTGGILDFIIGFVLVCYPGLTMAMLPYFLGFWLLFRGIMTIGTSFDLQSYRVKGWGWTLASGILAVVLSFFVIINPIFGGMSVLLLVGLALLFMGIFRIILSIYLRKLHKIGKDIED